MLAMIAVSVKCDIGHKCSSPCLWRHIVLMQSSGMLSMTTVFVMSIHQPLLLLWRFLQALNVLGTPLRCCCTSPVTGFYRDGFCRTGGGDYGVHVVCAQVCAADSAAVVNLLGTSACSSEPDAPAQLIRPQWDGTPVLAAGL